MGASEKSYDANDRYNDSLLIYNTYHSEVESLKKLKDTERAKWYALHDGNDSKTACAKIRLKTYNKEDYKPYIVFERKGYGEAYSYPKPSNKEHNTPSAFTKSDEPQYRFVVYDKQTRFISLKNCAVKIPYILKLVFDKGRLLFTEKLNPVTYEKLQVAMTEGN